VTESVDLLFDEFAARYARGEHPDAREYLERAGGGRDELARLLDGFLAAAPVQAPSAETVALFESFLETPPLLAERVRRGWRREEIVEWILERFGIGEEKREKVARYWHELETGLTPASGVSARLREALAERFGAALDAASTWQPPAPGMDLSYSRVQDAPALARPQRRLRAAAHVAEPERDEVDELFGRAGEL
jgi:hypothetical protein